ncbi:MAG: MnhB domain-containing protein [Methanolobus sp.]
MISDNLDNKNNNKDMFAFGHPLSISLLLAGHNNPGGGFIGGVMFASVIALTYVAYGLDCIKSSL